MSTEKKDKLHPTDLGETKDFDNLTYDRNKNSFVYDVKGPEKEYDHPLPYDTSAPNGEDSNSSYDESNPYIGSEYNDDEQIGENLEEAGMHIDYGEIVALAAEDELLARTPEDEREDLDEEGYPINDTPETTKKIKGLRQG